MSTIHYDPAFLKKRDLLPRIIQEELTEKQRLVIQSYYLRDATTAQIAQTMGITASAVLRLRKRAEARIAKCLRYC